MRGQGFGALQKAPTLPLPLPQPKRILGCPSTVSLAIALVVATCCLLLGEGRRGGDGGENARKAR